MSELGTALEEARPWMTTGGILGLLTLAGRQWAVIRKLRITEKGEDRDGYAALIEQQRIALDRANERIDRLETAASRKDELHELRLSQLRHRLNNMRMIFEVTIHLMKTSSSDRMPEIVEMIERMRREHEKEEAAETAAIAAALASAPAPAVPSLATPTE